MARCFKTAQIVGVLATLMATGLAGCAGSVGDGDSTEDDGGKEDDPDGDGGGGGGDDGGGGGVTCPGEPCDLYDQCGCEAGQACDLDAEAFATGGTMCRAVTTPGQSQADCSTDDECAAGYGCFGDPGQCRRYCEGDGDCGGGHCMIEVIYDASGGGDWQSVPDAALCTKSCKPESPAGGCPAERACDFYMEDPNDTPASGDEFWYTDCRPAGDGGNAASCEADGNDSCQSGMGCFSMTYSEADIREECRQICIWTVNGEPGDRSCGTGTCHEIGGDGVVIAGTEYGVCF